MKIRILILGTLVVVGLIAVDTVLLAHPILGPSDSKHLDMAQKYIEDNEGQFGALIAAYIGTELDEPSKRSVGRSLLAAIAAGDRVWNFEPDHEGENAVIAISKTTLKDMDIEIVAAFKLTFEKEILVSLDPSRSYIRHEPLETPEGE